MRLYSDFIKLHKETATLREKAMSSFSNMREEFASIDLPSNLQFDLKYFTAVFVSSGSNLNNAYFLPSELLKAEASICNKPMDIEHEERSIVGHIIDCQFVDKKEGNRLDLEEMASYDVSAIDAMDMDIEISGVVYKNRFPEVCSDIDSGVYKVSMECYYPSFDVLVGDTIMTASEAAALGIDFNLDKKYNISKGGLEINGFAKRVLRDIHFSGCGFVKEPANPESVIMETAGGLNSSGFKDAANLVYNDSVGICVYFKKEVFNEAVKDQDSTVAAKNWCSLYNEPCTSFSRDTTDPACLRNVVNSSIIKSLRDIKSEKELFNAENELVKKLDVVLKEAMTHLRERDKY